MRVLNASGPLYEVIKETSLPVGFVLSPFRTIRGLKKVSILSPETPRTMANFTRLVMLGLRELPE